MSVSPQHPVRRGALYLAPIGPAVAEVPYPTQALARPPDFSLWVHGEIQEPGLHLDHARMSTRLYQEVRDDLVRFAPVEVTRSAIRRSSHAYVGVIDSKGTPYYFALDSRGVSVREARPDDAAWKAFDQLATEEHMAAVRARREDAAGEMRRVHRELSAPLVVTKGLKYGKKVEWRSDVPHSSWWRNVKRRRSSKDADAGGHGEPEPGGEHAEKAETYCARCGTNPCSCGEDARRAAGNRYAAEYRRVGHELWLQTNDGESELDPPRPEDALWLVGVAKALPKKSKEAKTKKAPTRKASKKQAGAGGKTRYTYPREKSGARGGAGQAPLVVEHDDTKRADPAELAEQLGVSVRTLQRAARKLGSEAFPAFMRSRLKTFAQKHRLDPDYWGTLYAALVAGNPDGAIAKSEDAGLKKFGDDVKTTAAAVPEGHRERFGDRKVFIHHVHGEMKRHGLYSGGLDEFKRDVVRAHKKGHLTAVRADIVAAMHPHSVKQSETHDDGATFNFIADAKHDPAAAKKLEASRKPDKPKVKMSPKFHREVADTLSEEARDASVHATKVGTPEAHLAAMSAHHQAGAAHQKASGKVNHKAALAHFDQSMAHLKAARPR